jgi:16S rRNA (guanine527-N7)-methyltransferase
MELKDAEIRAALAPFGVDVGERLAGQIRVYVRTVLFWNQRVNLTAITEPREILARHFGESMFGAQFLERTSGTLADVGSGAGFPGLALKLACPALRVKLIEPTIKKAVFLSEVVRALELSGVEVMKERTEQISGLEVDVVTARAVGELSELLSWAESAVVANGQVLLWLGAADAERARQLIRWEWGEPATIPLSGQRVVLSGVKR